MVVVVEVVVVGTVVVTGSVETVVFFFSNSSSPEQPLVGNSDGFTPHGYFQKSYRGSLKYAEKFVLISYPSSFKWNEYSYDPHLKKRSQ